MRHIKGMSYHDLIQLKLLLIDNKQNKGVLNQKFESLKISTTNACILCFSENLLKIV